jgi:hypothetical protein
MSHMILDTKLQIFKTMKSICSSSQCGFRIAAANMELYMGQCWQVRLWFQFGKMVPFVMQEWRCESMHEQAFSQHSVSIPWQIGSDLTQYTHDSTTWPSPVDEYHSNYKDRSESVHIYLSRCKWKWASSPCSKWTICLPFAQEWESLCILLGPHLW